MVGGRWWGGLIRGGFVDLKLFSRLLQANMAKAQWCGKVGMARADCVAACGERRAAREERFIESRIVACSPGLKAGRANDEA